MPKLPQKRSSGYANETDAEFLLSRLHRGGNYWYLWTRDGNRSVWFRVGDKIIIPDSWKDIYFNVHPSDKHRTGARHKIENVKIVNSLYAEFDAKDFESEEAMRDHVNSLDPWASFSLHSGGGYHLYWFLREPFHIENEEDLEYIQELQRAWVRYVGGDTGAYDLARVLRLPGTRNFKYDPPRDVKTLSKSSEAYSLKELHTLAREYIDEGRKSTTPDGPAIERDIQGHVQISYGSEEGSRNVDIHKYGSSLVGRGYNDRQISMMVRYVNSTLNPPMDEDELAGILENVLNYPKPDHAPRPTKEDWFAITGSLGYEFRLNVLDDTLIVNGKTITDVVADKIKTDIRDFGLRDVNVALEAINGYATRFHPIKEYLEGLEWDGKDHIAKLIGHFKSKDGVFEDFGFRRWLIGAVERVYEDGKQNRVLVLDGEQGIGKSYFARWLGSAAGSEYYAEATVQPDQKDDNIRLTNTWIWEVPELGSVTLRRDIEALKHFLSRERIKERRPYGKYDINKPALASFIATVNNAVGFLNDPTGNRRFIATTITKIDWDFTDMSVHQVWAQAKALFDKGLTGDLDTREREIVMHENKRYEVENPIWDVLDRQVVMGDEDDFTPTDEILQRVRDKGMRSSDQEIQRQIKAWMMDNDIESKRAYIDGVQLRGYEGVYLRVTNAQSWMEEHA